MAWARMVAVVVPSPATSLVLLATSLTIWAPMFSNLSSSSISLATVTPSLVTVGAPKVFSSMTLRPLGPRVTFTALASALTPSRIDFLACSSYCNIFAPIKNFLLHNLILLLFNNAQDVILTQDEMVDTVNLHIGAGVFAEKNPVTSLDIELHQLPVFCHFAFTHGDDLPFHRFFLGRV